jgi:hypothetical protein
LFVSYKHEKNFAQNTGAVMKLIYKLNAITFFSTIIVIILLVFSIRNSQKNSTVLHSIEKGYFPSLLVNKNLESQLLEMKRTFLDAGMAGDSDMLNKNEGLMDSIKTELNMLLSYKIVHPDTIKSLVNNFNDYFTVSNSVVSDMISGNMGMDFGEKTVQMNQSYNQLENQIKQ